jgi:pimeloyl-ACP methyl ester carboxylesterase
LKIPPELKEEYPFNPKQIDLRSGYSMSYLDEGEGAEPPTLFLHGNPTWSFFYRKMVIELSEKARCIAPDHLGCGLSDKPSSHDFSYQLKDHSENILQLLDTLEIDQINLVVHDWGGAIGLTALASHSERVRKIVLLNTASFLSQDVPKRILFCRLPVIGQFFVRALNGFAWPATWMATTSGLNKTVKNGFLHPYNNWRNRVAIWNFVKDIPFEQNHPSRSTLQQTEALLDSFSSTPILACWGMKDFCFHGGFLNRWEEFWPHMEVHQFPHAGHYILEDDIDGVMAKVEPFLENS